MNRFEVRGVNDERDFCECCGKNGLKRVVWIEDMEMGDIKHFGTTCAQSPIKGFDCSKEIKKAIRTFEDKQKAIWAVAHRSYKALGGKYDYNRSDCSCIAKDMVLLNQCMERAGA